MHLSITTVHYKDEGIVLVALHAYLCIMILVSTINWSDGVAYSMTISVHFDHLGRSSNIHTPNYAQQACLYIIVAHT